MYREIATEFHRRFGRRVDELPGRVALATALLGITAIQYTTLVAVDPSYGPFAFSIGLLTAVALVVYMLLPLLGPLLHAVQAGALAREQASEDSEEVSG